MLSSIYWDPNPELFRLPFVHYPILWYGLLFALGFILGFPVFVGILTRYFQRHSTESYDVLRKQAVALTDKVTFYMIVATIVGARLGHLFFYESPSQYLRDPLMIIAVWKGGLASHGAAVAIPIALAIFWYRYRSQLRELSYLQLVDFMCVPTALAGAFIRVGNFFNQEILGTVTSVPWAVIFGHPADHSVPAPRHPVQLYEAICYLVIFFVLWRLTFKLLAPGKLLGLFLITVFGVRFLIEFLKLEQSVLISSWLTMGQLLSIPAILIGLLLWFRNVSK